MPLDIAVLDDDFRYKRHIHIDSMIHGVLFKKLVTPENYPQLGKAKNEAEDITVRPAMIPALVADLDKLEAYLKSEKLMSAEVKGRCLEFVAGVREVCEVALKDNKNVEFVAGE